MTALTRTELTAYELVPSLDQITDYNINHNTGEMVVERCDGSKFCFVIERDENEETAEGWSWAEYDAEGNCEGQGGDAFTTDTDIQLAANEIARWANEA